MEVPIPELTLDLNDLMVFHLMNKKAVAQLTEEMVLSIPPNNEKMAIQMTVMVVALTVNLNSFIFESLEQLQKVILDINVKEGPLLIVRILDDGLSEEMELNTQVKSEKMAIRVMEMAVAQLVK